MSPGRGYDVDYIIEHSRSLDNGWRKTDKLIMSINAIVLGYSLVIGKTLGKSFTGMSQLLLNEVGDTLAEMVDEIVGRASYSSENLAELIKRGLEESSIARNVVVEEQPPVEKHGVYLRRFRITIKDSLFKPIYGVLLKRGYQEFPLSPEAMLVAAIVRRILRKKKKDARLKVHAKLMEDGETLEIAVEELPSLKR